MTKQTDNQQQQSDGKSQEGTTADDSTGTDAAPEVAFKTKADFQAEVDRILKERLDRKERQAAEQADKARKEAEVKALEEKQEYQKLADARKKELDELQVKLQAAEPLIERVKTLEAALSTYRDQLIEGVPEGIKALLAKMPVEEQLTWLATNNPQGDGEQETVPPTKKPRQLARSSADLIASKMQRDGYSQL